MSRIGNKAIALPKGVSVKISKDDISVKGPKGELTRKIISNTSIEEKDSKLYVSRDGDSRPVRAYHGLMRALLANMVTGVSTGISKELELIGVGYKAEVKGNKLVLNLGFSHLIDYPFPSGIKIAVKQNPKSTVITILGIDKEVVGQTAAKIRSFRPPDSYKGKGVRYKGERIRLKAGKQ